MFLLRWLVGGFGADLCEAISVDRKTIHLKATALPWRWIAAWGDAVSREMVLGSG